MGSKGSLPLEFYLDRYPEPGKSSLHSISVRYISIISCHLRLVVEEISCFLPVTVIDHVIAFKWELKRRKLISHTFLTSALDEGPVVSFMAHHSAKEPPILNELGGYQNRS
jgi:hypothetical protein